MYQLIIEFIQFNLYYLKAILFVQCTSIKIVFIQYFVQAFSLAP